MKEIVFHQNARYMFAKNVIERMRSSEHLKILEVGSGGHGRLAEYLPADNLTLTDIDLPEEVLKDPRFEIADATKLPYANNSFDFVIGLDVLEHIPRNKRDSFLTEVIRVANQGIILAFPHAHTDSDLDDSRLRAIYRLMGSEPPIWVDEHIDCSLPDYVEIINRIQQIDPTVEVQRIFQCSRKLFSDLLQWEAFASCYPEATKLFENLNSQYNNEILSHDYCNEAEKAIKACVVISKKGKQFDLQKCCVIDENGLDEFGRFVSMQFLVASNVISLVNKRKDAESFDSQISQVFEVLRGLIGQADVNEGKRVEALSLQIEQFIEVLRGLIGQADINDGKRVEALSLQIEQFIEVLRGLIGQADINDGKRVDALSLQIERFFEVLRGLIGQADINDGKRVEALSLQIEQFIEVLRGLIGQADINDGKRVEALSLQIGQISEVMQSLIKQADISEEKRTEALNLQIEQFIEMLRGLIGQAEAGEEKQLENLKASHAVLERLLVEIKEDIEILLPPPPPPPVEIEKKLEMDVVLICYNQSQFIEQTVQSILEQSTQTFLYRIIVADDASQDDTFDKIKAIADKSDIEFVFLPHDVNHGIMLNYKRAFAACTSKYIAVMEGDDLWTDPFRLQRHYDFLQEHQECVMSFNCFDAHNFDTGASSIQPVLAGGVPFAIFAGNDIAYDNLIGGFSTCVYRINAIKALPEELYTWKGYDWLLNLTVSKFGLIGCLADVMNIYRIHEHGVWSGQDQKTKLKELIRAIDDYDEKLEGIYHEGFMAHRKRLKAMVEPEIIRKLKRGAAFVYRKARRASYYFPPVVVEVLKLLIPPVIKDKLRRHA